MTGNLKFLSHQETVKLIRTSVLCAGLCPVYSEGFNPRLRLCLPLPRTVGIESVDDVFCVQLMTDFPDGCGKEICLEIIDSLNSLLPQGCSVTSAELYENRVSFVPVGACYEFTLENRYGDLLRSGVRQLEAMLETGRDIILHRGAGLKGKIKKINAADYIETVKLCGSTVDFQCRITPAGTLRPEEIRELLKITPDIQPVSVKRKNVKWEIN